MDDVQRHRAAKNEALFRDVNERVKEIDEAHHVATDERWEFLCECALADCLERISLDKEEYETVRSNPVRFVVAPGHEMPDIEHVVRSGEGYVVVEKDADRNVARATDPRS